MQEVWAVKIYATFWLIFSASTPSDLQSLQELGEGLGHCLSKKAHRNGSDLVVKLGEDCSRDVDIYHENSWGRFIDFKLSVCARLLLSFVGFVKQKWLEWFSKCHKSANFSDRIAMPKTLMVRGMENLLPLKFWWKSTYPSVQCFLGWWSKRSKMA